HAGRVETVTVHGKALEGNLSGEPADREVSIYLPPSYDREKSRRYPVVILLHGYSINNKYWVGGAPEGPAGIDVPGAMDRDVAAGKAREMILVMPNGDSKYNGSMYSSSVTSGDWESFIAEDLVAYVDSHYRTIARRSSRGLAGHSMGGYGTIRIGMKRPDVFSSLYVLSACCLMNNPAGFAQRAPASGSAAPSGSTPPARASGSGANNNGDRPRAGGFANVVKAEAAAWSPNPSKPPTYFDAPGDEGVDMTLVAQKWAANSPLVMLDQYVANLKRYTAIGMDVGLQDTLLGSNQQLDKALTASGVQHTFATYEGDHVNHIADRMEQAVLPFFSEHLSGNTKR
ncbi:MAG TPA: alpha/beta hydrolase-fold protein, partial [Gammaproteobacteria bacterium]|nr:alpha/beta hydrolase-fold protein [Gammaproteobacteria bacterium]